MLLGLATPAAPCIAVSGKGLEVAHQFLCLGSAAVGVLLLDVGLSGHIGWASMALSRLIRRVWEGRHIMVPTGMDVYKACVISALLYGSES